MSRDVKALAIATGAVCFGVWLFCQGVNVVQSKWDSEKERQAAVVAAHKQKNEELQAQLAALADKSGKDLKNAKAAINAAYRDRDRGLHYKGVCPSTPISEVTGSSVTHGEAEAVLVLPAAIEERLYQLTLEADLDSEKLRELQNLLTRSGLVEVVSESE